MEKKIEFSAFWVTSKLSKYTHFNKIHNWLFSSVQADRKDEDWPAESSYIFV